MSKAKEIIKEIIEIETRPVSAIQVGQTWYGVDEMGNNLQEIGFDTPEEAKEYAGNRDMYWEKTRALHSSDASGTFYYGIDIRGNVLAEERFETEEEAQKYAIQQSVKSNL